MKDIISLISESIILKYILFFPVLQVELSPQLNTKLWHFYTAKCVCIYINAICK